MKIRFIKAITAFQDMTIGKTYTVVDGGYESMVDIIDDVGDANSLYPEEYEVVEE